MHGFNRLNNLDLPYTTHDFQGIGGKIRETIEDFIVEEVLVFEPEGEGEHLFVNMTHARHGLRPVSRRASV